MDTSLKYVLSFLIGVMALVIIFAIVQNQLGGFENFFMGAI